MTNQPHPLRVRLFLAGPYRPKLGRAMLFLAGFCFAAALWAFVVAALLF